MVEGDVEIPAFRGIDLGEEDGKVAILELHGGLAEATGAAGLHQSTPTFLQRAGNVDGSLQMANGEVGVQGTTEDSAEDHVASGVEFLISEVLDGEPDEGTECDQDEAAKVFSDGTEEDGESGEGSGRGIEDIGNATGGKAAGQETVVDVAAVWAEDGLAAEEAAGDGESGIEEGDGKCNEGSGHAEEGGGFLGPDDAEAAEEEADGEATAIAHEDGGGVEVVGEETEEGAEEGGSDEGEGVIAAEDGAEEGGGGGEDADAHGEAIEPIDEVEGIGTGDEPKHGEGNGEPGGGDGMPGDGVDQDTGLTGQECGDDLAEELHPGLEAEDVIEETGSEDDENGRQEGANAGERGYDGLEALAGEERDEGEDGRISHQNGDAAGAGDGSAMDLTPVGNIHPADAGAQGAARRGEGQREQQCGDREYEVGEHGVSLRAYC
jgi:hypothetical protein